MLTIAIQINKYSGNSKCDLLIFIRHDYITLPLIFSVKKLCKITFPAIIVSKRIFIYICLYLPRKEIWKNLHFSIQKVYQANTSHYSLQSVLQPDVFLGMLFPKGYCVEVLAIPKTLHGAG